VLLSRTTIQLLTENEEANEEAYECAQWQAEILLERGFHLGGVRKATREDLHSR